MKAWQLMEQKPGAYDLFGAVVECYGCKDKLVRFSQTIPLAEAYAKVRAAVIASDMWIGINKDSLQSPVIHFGAKHDGHDCVLLLRGIDV